MISKIYDNKKGFGYFYFQNNEKKVWLEAKLDFSASKNITIQGSQRSSLTAIVKPKSHWIRVFTATETPYSLSLRITHKAHLKQPKKQIKKTPKPKKTKTPKLVSPYVPPQTPTNQNPSQDILLKKTLSKTQSIFEFENISDLVYEINLFFELRNAELSEEDKTDPSFILFPGQKRILIARCLNQKQESVVRLLRDRRVILGM